MTALFDLIDQVGVPWIVLVILTSAALVALTVVFVISLLTPSRLAINRLKKLNLEMEELAGCRIENLEPLREIISTRMNPEFLQHFERLAEDSRTMFNAVWIPSPSERMLLPDILTRATRMIYQKTTGFAILLGGIIASVLAVVSGLARNADLGFDDNFRLIALLPIIIAALALLILNQTSESQVRQIQREWQLLMVTFERKLPVYSQGAETARLIMEMREYDAHMAKSVASVATHVHALSSGKLIDAISTAIKYVMSATVAPAIVKSTDALNLLVTQLDKQMLKTDLKVAKLYADLETNQEVQSEVWLKRYQEIAEVLASQQDAMLKNLMASEKSLADELSKSQKSALEKMVEEQHHTLEHINSVSQKSWTILKDKLTAILEQMNHAQTETYEQLLTRQTESFNSVAVLQREGLTQIQTEQTASMGHFLKDQSKYLDSMAHKQEEAVQHLAENFGSAVSGKLAGYLDPISARLSAASEAIIKSQSYAAEVQEVLNMQNDAATTLQASIEQLFTQLLETRKTMSEDLTSLKASSGIMSKAAEVMGSVYEGSQAGLSEAISQMSKDLMRLSEVLGAVMKGSAEQTRLMQTQSLEAYDINQKHLDAVRGQVGLLSDELATRIDQLMLGFGNMTEDMVKSVNASINNQNETLSGNLHSLTEIMSEEARSMSLFAQQINMDIDLLNQNLRTSVHEFDIGLRGELTSVLGEFDTEISEIVKRLARTAAELGDAVDALPEALRLMNKNKQS